MVRSLAEVDALVGSTPVGHELAPAELDAVHDGALNIEVPE